MVIQSILEENRRLYQSQYDEVVGRLLHIPKGSLRRQVRGGKTYIYLRRYFTGKGYKDVYLGPTADKRVAAMVTFMEERPQRIQERRTVVDALLRNLGFTARVDAAYNKIDYVLPGVGMVEVFIDRDQATVEAVVAVRQDLAIVPAAVANLQILIDNPVTTKIHGVHKAVTLPSMPAFFVHRLITAQFGEYRDAVLYPERIRKDLKQAALVAEKISGDKKLLAELKRIVGVLPDDLRDKMDQSASSAADYVQSPDLTIGDAQRIQTLAQAALEV